MPRFTRNLVDTWSKVIPLLSIVLTAVLGVISILSGLRDGDGEEPQPLPPIVHPGDPALEDQMRTDLLLGVHHQRGFEGLDLNIERHNAAQRWAERNAATGKEENSPEDIGMVQAHLPSSDANASAFLGLWMSSPAHAAVVMNPDYTGVGIGVASHNGITYAVVQFTRA